MKLCRTCGVEKSVNEFNRRGNGLQAQCRSCQSAWYLANKSHHVANVRRRQRRIKTENVQLMCDYLRQHPCIDCGEDDLVVLDFDHVSGDKIKPVSVLVREGREWWRIEAEIAKCEVRCANCHRRATARRAGNWAKSVLQLDT